MRYHYKSDEFTFSTDELDVEGDKIYFSRKFLGCDYYKVGSRDETGFMIIGMYLHKEGLHYHKHTCYLREVVRRNTIDIKIWFNYKE